MSEEKTVEQLKAEAFEALQKAESAMHKYACALDIEKGRENEFGCFENIRIAWRKLTATLASITLSFLLLH